MAGKKLHLLCGSFFLMVGVLDFLYKPILFNDRHRQLLTDISSHRGYGTHYVSLNVGSNNQLMRLAVATGSDYTALPCQGCYTCREPHFQFAAESLHQCPGECLFPESTCQDGGQGTGCHIVVQYSSSDDLSGAGYRGVEVTDYVYSADTPAHLAAKEAFPLHFICQEDAIGDAIQADGYLGMSNAPLSYINQLHAAKKIEHNMFSLCFQDYDSYQATAPGSSAGHVTFGHVDRNLLDSQLVWAANKASTESLSSYAVHVRRVYLGVGGSPNYLQSAAMGTMTMVPIGTTTKNAYAGMNGESGAVLIQTNQPVSYLHESIEKAFKKEFREITGMKYTVPAFKMTEEQFQHLPTVFIQMEANLASQGNTIAADLIPGFAGRHDHEHPYDILLAVPPEHYLIHLDGMAFPTLRFSPDKPRIASNLLQNHELVFDLEHNRIGFAERNHCPEGMSIMKIAAASSPRPQVRGINVPLPQERSGPQDRDHVTVTSDAEYNPNIAVDDTQLGSDAPTRSSSRTIEGSDTAGNNQRPVEGVSSSGEVIGHSEVYTPDSEVYTPDTSNESSGSSGRNKGRTIGGGSQTTQDQNPGSGLNQEQNGGGSLHATQAGDATETGAGNGITGELDVAGESNGETDQGGSENEDVGISDNFQPGVSSGGGVGSRTSGGAGPLEEHHDGLPNATATVGLQALRIGPGAVSASEGLVNSQYNDGEYDFMNILGLAMFFLGFSATIIFTQENFGAEYAHAFFSRAEVPPGDDTNDARTVWSKGESFYNKSGSEKFKRQKSFKLVRGASKKWFGAGRDGGFSSTASGLGADSSGGKRSGKSADDRSQYASDERTTYTGADRTYYTQQSERPYYDRSQSVKGASDKSESGSFYQAYSQPDETSSSGGSGREESPYYDRSKRYVYSQSKSARSIYSQDDASYDYPQKPHFDDFDDSERRNQLQHAEQSVRSFYSPEDAVYYPKKKNLNKFIKPVNSSDRSVLARDASERSGYSYSDHSGHSESHSGGGTVPQDGRYYEEAPYGDYDESSRGGGTFYSESQYNSSRGEIYHDEPPQNYSGAGTYYDDEAPRNDSGAGNYYDEEPRGTSGGQTYYEDHGTQYQDSPYDGFEEETKRGTARDRSIIPSDSYADGGTYRGSASINDGDSYSGIDSFADDTVPDLPQRPQPMSQLPEADEYSGMDSFYVDEPSLSSKKLPRRNYGR